MKKILFIITIGIPTIYLTLAVVVDFFGFNREKTDLLLGKDSSIRLLASITNIDPNSGRASIDFSLTVDSTKGSTIKDRTYDLWLVSGNILAINDNEVIFEPESRFCRANLKFIDKQRFPYSNVTVIQYKTQNATIKISPNKKGYLFPLDNYTLRLNFVLTDNYGKDYSPSIDIESADSKFLVSHTIHNFTVGKYVAEYPNSFFLIFYRPHYLMINLVLILLLSLSIVSYTIYRVVASQNIRNISPFEILGLNLTIIITFPGLRSSIVPTNVEYAPLFDISSILIWALSLLAIFLFFAKEHNWFAKKPSASLKSNNKTP